uniref:Uncharacterized protein n=1 Tax=Tarsiger cyanurus ambidensovirus TaxID=2794449 RepID=A0A8E7L5M0_9VIRU|nr:MAG: hypothetical protein [Tarsiger cyanurus ambidensovirus]
MDKLPVDCTCCRLGSISMRSEKQLVSLLSCTEEISDMMFALQSAIDTADDYIRRSSHTLLTEGESLFAKLNSPIEFASKYLEFLGDEKQTVVQLQPHIEAAANRKKCPEMFLFVLQHMSLTVEEMEMQKEEELQDSLAADITLPPNYWASVSSEDFLNCMRNNKDITSYQILFLPRHAKELKQFLEGLKAPSPAAAEEVQLIPSKALHSSTTPKRVYKSRMTEKAPKKRAISTSITSAPTAKAGASANLFGSSHTSSDDDLETMLQSIPTKQTTGGTGSSIFYKSQGKSFSFKSALFPLGQKYIDLKVR